MQAREATRKIIHVDMDCFYAAVEQRDRPEWKGKPLAVGGPPDRRGVICTASYEARVFGVRSAMATSTALKLCPNLILAPVNFAKYKKASRVIREIFAEYTLKIEPLSLDEAYLDVTGSSACHGSATLIAQEIRKKIFQQTRLTASAGVAPNKFLAKVASDWNKPNGIMVVSPEEASAFARELPVEKIFGVGKVTAKKMHALGLKTCADILAFRFEDLEKHSGSWAATLRDNAEGIDHREVEFDSERKSLSVEETYDHDLVDQDEIRSHLGELYLDWLERFDRFEEKNGRASLHKAFVKLKFADFRSTTHECVVTALPELAVFREYALRLLILAERSQSARVHFGNSS